MKENRKTFYKSPEWHAVRQAVIDRDKGICYFCGQIVLKRMTVHHIQELNEENWMNPEISLNLDNLVLCHAECHNEHHKRWGYKESIANDDLTIDYSKRKR